MNDNVVEWEGSGWYASRQAGRYESQRVETVRIPWTGKLGENDWREADECARSAGLGTPVYAKSENDLS